MTVMLTGGATGFIKNIITVAIATAAVNKFRYESRLWMEVRRTCQNVGLQSENKKTTHGHHDVFTSRLTPKFHQLKAEAVRDVCCYH